MFIEVTPKQGLFTQLVNAALIYTIKPDAAYCLLFFSASDDDGTYMRVLESYDEVKNLIYGATGDARYRRPQMNSIPTMHKQGI
jgi:hypothetical protein